MDDPRHMLVFLLLYICKMMSGLELQLKTEMQKDYMEQD